MKDVLSVFLTLWFVCTSASAPGLIDQPDPLEQIRDTYLRYPFLAGVLAESWEDPAEIDPDSLIVFSVYHKADKWFDGSYEISEMNDPLVPAAEVEAVIQGYFDVPASVLRSTRTYDPAKNAYGVPGLGGASNCTVTKAEQGSLLYLHYNHYQDAMLYGDGVLTVALSEDGSFRYTANTFAVHPGVGREQVDALFRTVVYDPEVGELRLTVPEEALPRGCVFHIVIGGRVRMGPGSMSIHPFAEESGSGGWIPGKTYTYPVDPEDLDELHVLVGIQNSEGTVMNTIEATLDSQGGRTFF